MTLSLYSTLQKLTPTGRSKPVLLPAADRYLQTHSADPTQLFESQDPITHFCLRCFISHTIVTTVRSLVNQYGTNYHFREEDLLPIVLDDDGTLIPSVGVASLLENRSLDDPTLQLPLESELPEDPKTSPKSTSWPNTVLPSKPITANNLPWATLPS